MSADGGGEDFLSSADGPPPSGVGHKPRLGEPSVGPLTKVFKLPGVKQLRREAETYLLIVATLVGLVMGVITAAFRYAILQSHHFFSEAAHFEAGGVAGVMGRVAEYGVRALLPAVGGLLVGLLIYRVLNLEGGHGVPSVMKALAVGRVNLSAGMAVKASTSIVTVASGGSSGPEGPIVEIGSVIGSRMGHWARLDRESLGTLIGCGAAAGAAGVFNAPIGGVFLAIELLLRDFAVRTFGPIVIAAVVASVTSAAILPNSPVFQKLLPETLATLTSSPQQLLMAAILGLLCSITAQLLVTVIFRSHDLFHQLHIPTWLKPGVGGLLVGLVGLGFPTVIGEGYGFVNESILERMQQATPPAPSVFAAIAFIIVVAVKLLATSLTLGSGGTGGAFAPSMVAGASLGAGFGVVCQMVAPEAAPSPAVMAMIGMAGCVASALHIPIAAILIIYEISGTEYRLVLPLMVCVAISSLVSARLRAGSVYTLSLLRDGFDLEMNRRRAENPLGFVSVESVMDTTVVMLRPGDDMRRVLDAFTTSDDDAFLVVDERGWLQGVISVRDLRAVLHLGDQSTGFIAADAADPDPAVLPRSATADQALALFTNSDLSAIAVVESETDRTAVGLISRADVLRAYRKAMDEIKRGKG